MRDAVAMELSGRPTVTLSHDVFERAAQAQAKALGLPDIPLIIEPSPKRGNVTLGAAAVGESVIEDVVDGLTSPPGEE